MASVIWVGSDDEDVDNVVEFIEPRTPRKRMEYLAEPSTSANTRLCQNASTPHKKRQRTPFSEGEIEILDTPKPKMHKSIQTKPFKDRVVIEEDLLVALELQRKWDEEDALARKQAAETEEKSLRLIARLQKIDQNMTEKRLKLR